MRKIIVIAALVYGLYGCASIVSDHNYAVSVVSDVPGTEFVVKNKSGQIITKGTTPTIINLESSSGYFSGERYTFEARNKGYEDGLTTIQSSVSGWYIGGNILFGGLIGWFIVDPLTGAMYNLPEKVMLNIGAKLNDNEEIPLSTDFAKEPIVPVENKETAKVYIEVSDNPKFAECLMDVYINNKKLGRLKIGDKVTYEIDYKGYQYLRVLKASSCPMFTNKYNFSIQKNEIKNIKIE